MLSDRLPGGFDPGYILVRLGPPVRGEFHLHPGNALLRPAAKLLLQLGDGVAREAAAAVDGHLSSASPQHQEERLAMDSRLQVPECRIDRRDGGGGNSGTAHVANRVDHCLPTPANVLDVPPAGDLGQQRADQGGGSRARVAVTQTDVSRFGRRLDQHHRRGVPLNGPVGLRQVGRDSVDAGLDVLDPGSHALTGSERHVCPAPQSSPGWPSPPLR